MMSKTANGSSIYSLAGLEAAGVVIKRVVQKDGACAQRSRTGLVPASPSPHLRPVCTIFSANTVSTGSSASSGAYSKIATESWTPF